MGNLLHFPVVNSKLLFEIIEYFFEENRLDDLKQIFAAVLWDKLRDYDIKNSLLSLQFIMYDVLSE